MSPVLQLLQRMRGRESMYVGTKCLRRIAAFLRGYQLAEKELAGIQDDDTVRRFYEYVKAKYHVSLSRSWDEIICFHSGSDEEALALFWKDFDAFLADADNR